MQLKALSIRQPWAWLIVEGYKDIENRVWRTNHRGRFLIHASRTFDDAGYFTICRERDDIDLPARAMFHRGGIIGIATIVDCVHRHESEWFNGPLGFVISDPRRLQFIPYRGKLNFFPVSFSCYDAELVLHQ